jgi:hypothetical protein
MKSLLASGATLLISFATLLITAFSGLAVTLTWDALPQSSGVVGYDVMWGPVAGSPTQHQVVGNVVTAVVAATGTNYFQVTGRDEQGATSKPSNQVVWPAPAPSPPVLAFSLSWNVVANATKYRVYEGTTQIAEVSTTTYSLAGKVGPKSYQVAGVNSAGVLGPKSNTVSLAAPTPTPTPTPTPVPTPVAPVLQLISS